MELCLLSFWAAPLPACPNSLPKQGTPGPLKLLPPHTSTCRNEGRTCLPGRTQPCPACSAAHPGGMRDFVGGIRYTGDTQASPSLFKSKSGECWVPR